MGKVYKDKKSSGCAMCKPHKHGWAPKKKVRTVALEEQMDKEIAETMGKEKKFKVELNGIEPSTS